MKTVTLKFSSDKDAKSFFNKLSEKNSFVIGYGQQTEYKFSYIDHSKQEIELNPSFISYEPIRL